jgi:hypothetical protein
VQTVHPLLKGNTSTFGGKADLPRLVVAKRVEAKAARATPEFISSSKSRTDSMRSQAINVNARAADFPAGTKVTTPPWAEDSQSILHCERDRICNRAANDKRDTCRVALSGREAESSGDRGQRRSARASEDEHKKRCEAWSGGVTATPTA